MSTWQTESLRLTAFFSDAAPVSEFSLWKDAVGHDPEIRESQPRKGAAREFGPYPEKPFNLDIRIKGSRIDWLLTPQVDPADALTHIPTVGDFPQSLDDLRKLSLPSLQRMKPARLAVGIVLFKQVNSLADGYAELKNYLPLMNLDTEGARDLLIQINRPRPSKVIETLELNRVMKWSVAMITGIQIGISASPTPNPSELVSAPTRLFATRVDLDLNTSALWSGLLTADPAGMVEELMQLGIELAEKGDVR